MRVIAQDFVPRHPAVVYQDGTCHSAGSRSLPSWVGKKVGASDQEDLSFISLSGGGSREGKQLLRCVRWNFQHEFPGVRTLSTVWASLGKLRKAASLRTANPEIAEKPVLRELAS